jgi:hypothetical protein
MPKKPKAKPAHQRARRTRKKRRARKKPQSLVIGFSAEARRQLSQQAGLDPEQPLKYGSGIPTVTPEQLSDLLGALGGTPLGHGVVRVDGPTMIWHETPKAWLEEAVIADYFRQFCEALGVKPGLDQCRPDQRMLQALRRMVMMNRRLLQDVPPLLKGFYWVAEDDLNLRPLKISQPESIDNFVRQLLAIAPNMKPAMAREIAAKVHGVEPETAQTYCKRHERRMRKKSGA